MKNRFFLILLSSLSIQSIAQSDLSVGTSYHLNLQRQNNHADAWILHNAEYSSGNDLLKWETTSANFGYRGIRFAYSTGRGIYFYAQEGATTEGAEFTPVTRFFIGNDGKTGVGTSTPQTQFQIMEPQSGGSPSGTTPTQGILISGNSTGGALNMGIDATGIFYSWIQSRNRNNSNVYSLSLNPTGGNVGIGLINPEGKLHVKGVAYFGNENGNSWHRVAVGGSGGNYGSVGYGYKYTGTSFQHTYAVADYASQLGFDAGGFTFRTAPLGTAGTSVTFADVMKILQNGRVGIGTTTPDAKLAVKGTVHAEEVKVDLNVPGPDYVFEPTYQLPTLNEIEKYIKANKHLPEVPSAKEMETNGINLSEMNMLLLKKVEELTLHLIEANKKIEYLTKRIDEKN